MPFNVKKRGKLTYYFQGDRPVLSALVTEEQPDGDLQDSLRRPDRRLLGQSRCSDSMSW